MSDELEMTPARPAGQLEVLALSLSMTAPTAGVATLMPLVAAEAGSYAWISWTFGTIAILAVGYVIIQLTHRYTTTGGLYALATKAGGGGAGFVTACMMLAFLFTALVGVAIIFGLILGPVLHSLVDIPAGQGTNIVLMYLALVLTSFLSYRGVTLSLKVMLGLEAVSISLVGVLLIVALAQHHGSVFDSSQLGFGKLHLGPVFTAAVFVAFAFSGFEESSVLGLEAKNPKRAISVAIIGSVTLAGILFIVAGYIMTLTLGPAGVAGSPNALAALATHVHAHWLVNILGLCISASLFSALLAPTNALGHLLLTMSRERLLLEPLSRISHRTKTPGIAYGAALVASVASLSALVIGRSANDAWYGYTSTYAGYTIILAYIITSIATGVFLWRRKELRVPHVVGAVVATATMGYVLYKSAIPIPAWPGNLILYLFFGLVVIAIGAYVILRTRYPSRLSMLGKTVDQDTVTADERLDGLALTGGTLGPEPTQAGVAE